MRSSSGISRSRSERFSRSSGLAYHDLLSPIRAIVSRIKELDNVSIDHPNQNMVSSNPVSIIPTAVKFEEVVLNRKVYRIRRVFISGDNRYKIAWVVDHDLKMCMVCRHKFGWTRFRHHCRSCGSLICNSCSPFKAIVPGLETDGESRICKQCFGLRSDDDDHSTDRPQQHPSSSAAVPSQPTESLVSPGIRRASSSGHILTPSSLSSSAPSTASLAGRSASNNRSGSVDSPSPAMRSPAGQALVVSSPRTSTPIASRFLDFNTQLSDQQTPDSVSSSAGIPNDYSNILSFETCYRMMRVIVPVSLTTRSNRATMIRDGIPPDIAARIHSTKALWLICMHPSDIEKIFLGDLRGKYQAYNLDLVEMKALWHQLLQVDWGRDPSDAEKNAWKNGFRSKLEDMEQRERSNGLLPSEKRNFVYQSNPNLQVYDPTVIIGPRRSRATWSDPDTANRSLSSSFNAERTAFAALSSAMDVNSTGGQVLSKSALRSIQHQNGGSSTLSGGILIYEEQASECSTADAATFLDTSTITDSVTDKAGSVEYVSKWRQTMQERGLTRARTIRPFSSGSSVSSAGSKSSHGIYPSKLLAGSKNRLGSYHGAPGSLAH